eukprot:scaffold286547_cov15-Tisochrysis_lutea.AAC.1
MAAEGVKFVVNADVGTNVDLKGLQQVCCWCCACDAQARRLQVVRHGHVQGSISSGFFFIMKTDKLDV